MVSDLVKQVFSAHSFHSRAPREGVNFSICCGVWCPRRCRWSSATTDANGIWWDLKQAIEVKSSPADIFQRFGMLDVHWSLGGPVCKRPDALMLPDVRIVDDDSYVRNANIVRY